MSTRRKSTISHGFNSLHARASVASIFSATDDYHDEDDDQHKFSYYISKICLNKTNVYHVLERQEGTRTLVYHLFVFSLTLLSLIFGSISTIDQWRIILNKPLYYGEFILCIFFTCELVLRIWSAGCLPKYRTLVGRFIFISRLVIIVDILTLIGFTLSLMTGLETREFPLITLKILLALQMIRFLRVDRKLSSWKILKGIIITHRQELTVTLVIAFMFLLTGSYLVYIAETSVNTNSNAGPFRSIADSIWFSIITMTTIGFGDLYPTTYVAKMITTTICFLGVAFWCLPAGIIGSGLAIKVQEQKRDEAFNRLVPAAASVIRNWWRLRCAYHGNRYVSTWKIYTLTQRRATGLLQPPALRTNPDSAPPLSTCATNHLRPEKTPFRFSFTSPSTPKPYQIRRKSITNIDDLPKRYITAIKIIRILKYSVACKKFQQAKRPIDLKDVVNENTQMTNRLSMMLNDIQRRLDFVLGTTKTASYLSDEQKRQLSLSARIEKLEELTDRFETKLNRLEQLALKLVENKKTVSLV